MHKEVILAHVHNSPEYCPCPLVPRYPVSGWSVRARWWGPREPSPLRGPVEPLEDAVPEELWPPGDGKQGLL